jgi:hypothetical protein
MVLLGLLLIALVCLVLGLVLPSVAWLIASLIATAGAAYLLVRYRRILATRARSGAAPTDGSVAAPVVAAEAAAAVAAGAAESTESVGEPATAAPAAQSAPLAAPGDVWVIDGRPRYHLESCAIIQGQAAEPIPYEQANEDGFMPCSLCEPDAARTTHP